VGSTRAGPGREGAVERGRPERLRDLRRGLGGAGSREERGSWEEVGGAGVDLNLV
jgi:hypothetical protein